MIQKRRGTAALVAACALLAAARVTAAPRQEAQWRVDVGFNGIVPPGAGLVPVVVTIENRVASTAGELYISNPGMAGESEVMQAFPFVSPAPSVKRFELLARADKDRRIEISGVFKEHVASFSKKPHVRTSKNPLVLCVGAPRAFATGSAEGKYDFLPVAPEILPSNPLALTGVHAVIVSGLAFASLGKSQVGALRDWASTGGALVFVEPGRDESFTRNLKLLSGEASPSVEAAGIRCFGRGALASSGFAPAPDAACWEIDRRMELGLFPALDPGWADTESHTDPSGFFTDMWRTQRTYGVGGIFWLVLIVGAYILTIGPLDWWIVRRIRKPALTWVFFPTAIVLFSLLAYGYTRLVNVGVMRMVQVNVIDAAPDQGVARGESLLWLYSAKNAAYLLDTPVENVFFSGRESALGSGGMAGVEIRNGVNSCIRARIPIFSAKEFDASWFMPWPHKVEVERLGTNVLVRTPPELGVERAFIAGYLGLEEMEKTDEGWRSDGSAQRWDQAIKQRSASLRVEHDYPFFFGSGAGQSSLMPSRDKLMNYLICLSFARKGAKSDPSGSNFGSQSGFEWGRNEREKSLDVTHRLRLGRELLLVLNPADDMLPVRVAGHAPQRARMSVVRIRIP